MHLNFGYRLTRKRDWVVAETEKQRRIIVVISLFIALWRIRQEKTQLFSEIQA